MSSSGDAVRKLLDQYSQYKQLLLDIHTSERNLAKAKIAKKDVYSVQHKHDTLRQKLQNLSDAMTFSSPLVWVQYKYYAYQNESQPIKTMRDFRIHCSKPGYICTKRFDFTNDYVRSHNEIDFSDNTLYEDSTDLSDLLHKTGKLHELSENEDFMRQWNQHEYYKESGRVAKWENYT